MKNLINTVSLKLKGLLNAIYRFPFTVLCLVAAAVTICYMISLEKEPTDFFAKLILTLALGAMAGAAAQSAAERFKLNVVKRIIAYAVSLILTIAYYFILYFIKEINLQVSVRTIVAVFALLCLFLYIPTFKSKVNFSKIALTNFKYIFTSILFSVVLSIGISAIIGAIHFLLIRDLTFKTYAYANVIIWTIFAPVYYLALLPLFNSEEEKDKEYTEFTSQCPKFLEVLFSYILVPLLSAFTLVLVAYFIKILILLKWPVGQLGPMILAYSAVGLIVFILSANLKNKFANFFSKVFPKVLIPVVIMQLISVGIRLNAYGVTESRYYVALFGIFSLVSAVYLSFIRNRNGLIALLVAGFALISVIPPVDAFTISRVSQTNRLEKYLTEAGILKDGKLTPKENVSENTKKEVRSILQYLDRQDYTSYINWLPKDFVFYDDMKKIIGIEPYDGYIDPYTPNQPEENYKSAVLNEFTNIDISSCDILINDFFYTSSDPKYNDNSGFTSKNKEYHIDIEKIDKYEALFKVKTPSGKDLISTKLYDKAKLILENDKINKLAVPREDMTIETQNNGYTLRIVFKEIKIYDQKASYSMQIMFGAPK